MIIDTDRWRNIPDIICACNELKNMFVALVIRTLSFGYCFIVKSIDEYSVEELDLILQNKKVNRSKNYIDIKIAAVLGTCNKSNIKTDEFLPGIGKAVSQSKALDISMEPFPSKLDSHVYKLMEKIQNE